MTKIALIADVHVANFKRFGGPVVNGLNRRARETIQTIFEAGKICRREKVDALVVLGDLFDHPHPNPSLVRATAEALLSCAERVVVLLGNHDMQSDGEWDHACSSMGLHDKIQVVSEPEVVYVGGARREVGSGSAQLLVCPYRPGPASEWLPASLAQLSNGLAARHLGGRVLCTHLGIWDDETPSFLKAAKDAVGIGQVRWLCDAHGIDCVYAGNWHGQKIMGLGQPNHMAVIPGALCPQGFQEADQTRVGSLSILSIVGAGISVSMHPVPGPRWFTLDCPPEGVSPGVIRGVTHQYVRLVCRQSDVGAALASKARFDAADGYTCVVQVAGDEDGSLTKEASAAARAASSPELAMEAFASFANVDEPGTKGGVLRRLMEYRKASVE